MLLTMLHIANCRKVFGNIDFLGVPREMRSEEQLKVIAEEYEDISFVILSDLWLDQPKVMQKESCCLGKGAEVQWLCIRILVTRT